MSAKLAVERPVALEVRVYCGNCSAAIHLLGPARDIRCSACGTQSLLSPSLWQEIVTEADEHSFDSWGGYAAIATRRSETPWGNVLYRWQSSVPACRVCRGAVSLVEVGSEGSVACAHCGAGMETRPVPSFLRREVGTAMQLYGAAQEGLAAVGGPDAFACLRCGRDCVLPAGDHESIGCASCGSSLSVPQLLSESPLRPDRVFWITFQGAPPRIAARLARQTLDVRVGTSASPSILSEAVTHTLESVESAKRERRRLLLLIVAIVLSCLFGLYYWRFQTKRAESDDFTFDPRSSE
jgi:hypothetical protein